MTVGPSITITGLEEVSRTFKKLSTDQAVRALARGLAAGAVPIVREVVARCPEREEGSRDENLLHLVDAIETRVQVDPGGQGGKASIGFGRLGYLVLWVEYGHRMMSHGSKGSRRQLFGPKTPDGRVKSIPFMREGLDAASDEAIEAFAKGFEAGFMESI